MPKMSDMPNMIQLLDYGEGFIRKLLLDEQRPELMPMYHLISPDEGVVLGCPWSCEEEKLAMVEMVKQKSREIGATVALFMAEAWVSRSPAGLSRKEADRWVANSAPPSQQPDRQEVVQLIVTDGDQLKTRVLQIKRGEGGSIVALVMEPDGPELMTGRLIDGIIPSKHMH